MKIKLAVLTVFSSFIVMLSHVNSAAAPGDLDPTFGVGGKIIMPVTGWLIANRTVPQPDGKFLTIGFDDGPSERFSFRHSGSGAVDTTFRMLGLPYNVDFFDFAIQSDLKILAVREEGYLVGGNYRSAFGLYRFNTDGTIDPSFGTNGIVNTHIAGNSYARHIVLQSDGKIVVAGMASDSLVPYPYTGVKIALARYLPNGALDGTFGTDGIVVSDAGTCRVFIQPDDKLLCRNNETVIRYNLNGTPDNDFGVNGKINVGPDSGAMTIQSDGKILAGVSGNNSMTVRRYMPNGTVDSTFGINGSVNSLYWIRALAVQPNGKILGGGTLNGNFLISRYSQDGAIDTAFGTNGSVATTFQNGTESQIDELILQRDNKIVATGKVALGSYYTSIPAIVRFLNDPVEASVGISGRILKPDGQALRNAIVRLIDSEGIVRTATTSSFGLYAFTYLVPGQEYTITVASKRYRFAPRTLSTNTNLTGVDLFGLQ